MNFPEKSVVVIIFILLCLILGNFQRLNVINSQGDTAMLLDVVENTAKMGVPYTRVNAAVLEASKTWFDRDIEKICTGRVPQTDYAAPNQKINQLRRHAYFIAYPLAALTWLGPTSDVVGIANAVSFATILLVVYIALRKRRVPILAAALFSVMTLAHPAWSAASVGQLYSDRFFMPFALLFAVITHEAVSGGRPASSLTKALIVCLGLLAASTTERGAIMIAGFGLAYVALHWRLARLSRLASTLICFSLSMVLYAGSYLVFFSNNDQNIAPNLSTIGDWQGMLSPASAWAMASFLLVNVGFYGFFAAWRWRLAVIAFASMLPNLLIVGPLAYKIMFLTHYHSMYFPFLVFASAYGFATLWESLDYRSLRASALIACTGLAVVLASIETATGTPTFSTDNLSSNSALRALRILWYGKDSAEFYFASQKRDLQQALPLGSSVITVEGLFPTFYQDHFVYYYPAGLEKADYAVLPSLQGTDGRTVYSGAITYAGDPIELNRCLNVRLATLGYDLEHPILAGGFSIIRHKK